MAPKGLAALFVRMEAGTIKRTMSLLVTRTDHPEPFNYKLILTEFDNLIHRP